MALNFNTVEALINKYYIPKLVDNIFTDNHYLWYLLRKKKKMFDERKIVCPLEYANSKANVQTLTEYGVMPVTPVEVATAAEYEPQFLTGSILFSKKEQLINHTASSIKNILEVKMNNLRKSMQEVAATNLWARGTSIPTAPDWNSVDHLVNAQTSVAVGGIPASGTTPSWWLSKVIDLTGSDYVGDPTKEEDLTDPDSDVYIMKIYQRMIAQSKFQTGEKGDLFIVPQYIWDLTEGILDPQKTGSALSEKAGKAGFDVLMYRRIEIVADDDMVAAQTGGTDGRIYLLNMEYLYLFLNSGADFKAEPFVQLPNSNVKSSLVNAFGNVAISNRRVQVVATGIKSSKTYSN